MPKILLSTVVALAAVLAVTLSARAAEPFVGNAFQAAQSAGKTILIDVRASWCPVCKQQKPIIAAIEKERPNLVVYEVDFDTAKDVLRRFQVQRQSTLIVFKGEREVGRSIADTDPTRIRDLVAKGF
jgi:thioredoxin 1